MHFIASIDLPIIVVLLLLLLTVYLFLSERLPVDVSAMVILVMLGFLRLIPGLEGLLSNEDVFSGFSSNAVIAIIAVMMIGSGLERTGLMHRVADLILKSTKNNNSFIMLAITTAAATLSTVMQNIGAAALFIPVVSRVSRQSGIPMSRLLIPMSFAVILGGTVTLVASGPMILLNDLLPESSEPFGFLSAAPLGLALVVTGIGYLVFFGQRLLPKTQHDEILRPASNSAEYYQALYGIRSDIHVFKMLPGNSLAGKNVGQIEESYRINIIALHGRELILSPHREIMIESETALAVIASDQSIAGFESMPALEANAKNVEIREALSVDHSGIAEVILPPHSSLLGRTIRSIRMRKTFGMSTIAIYRGTQIFRKGLRDIPLLAGDTLLVHVAWRDLNKLETNPNFTPVTTDYPKQQTRPDKLNRALLICALTLCLMLFTSMPLASALMTGAITMVLTNVLSMNDAYKAISWKTVFLLAGLIPLGKAMENSGAASWIANQSLGLLGTDPQVLVVQLMLILLATFFSLVMSNVGAVIILVPLASQIALGMGQDPRIFALLIAVGVSNSFLIPTNQVNALVVALGGYRVIDFIRVGWPLTILFIVVTLTMLQLYY
ncbi:MAG: SLC13 family permease [Pseudomonadales bacterium]|nr:SLC13 family permease [Pseudomonadales bacterium]